MDTQEVTSTETVRRLAPMMKASLANGVKEGQHITAFRVLEVPYIGKLSWETKDKTINIQCEVYTLDPKETKRYTMPAVKVDGKVAIKSSRKVMPALTLVAMHNFKENI